MQTEKLLQIAREIIAGVPACLAITVDSHGDANARVVNPAPLSDIWTVRFATDRRSRKVAEIERSGRLTLAYQNDADKAYVSLIGRAAVGEDIAAKLAGWGPLASKWFPGGPTDPNVVHVELFAERIELWSVAKEVVPDPVRGLWAAVLIRDGAGWIQSTTLPQVPAGEDSHATCQSGGAA
ncbi:pyridoxamine 5'-phosphate oxidase family protein [Bradyrhizobium diazoefficiens]|nr:pyridoxamine 5'-phosphate oxidase family protein [Bradyrhizobium diazoefficiens]MBR0779665.1 pyridoxamine 5'-phosphate oxidase family protein [Bradyrhizobium diazoefficiens]